MRQAGTVAGWATISKWGVQIETETVLNRSRPKRLRKHVARCRQQVQPGCSATKDRSDIETEIPSHVKIEAVQPRPAPHRRPRAGPPRREPPTRWHSPGACRSGPRRQRDFRATMYTNTNTISPPTSHLTMYTYTISPSHHLTISPSHLSPLTSHLTAQNPEPRYNVHLTNITSPLTHTLKTLGCGLWAVCIRVRVSRRDPRARAHARGRSLGLALELPGEVQEGPGHLDRGELGGSKRQRVSSIGGEGGTWLMSFTPPPWCRQTSPN